MPTGRRTGRITVSLPLAAFLIGSALAGPAPDQAQEVRWYHVYGRDGFLGWYLPRSERPVKHHWPVTLVWFDEAQYAWYYTSNPDVLGAVQQLIDRNLDVGNLGDERTLASAIHFHSAARDPTIASTRWVRLDQEAYLKFPSGLSAYIHELGRLQSPQPAVGPDDATTPAPMSAGACCRWIMKPDCFTIIRPAPDFIAAPHAATSEACDAVDECAKCTVCCNTWSNGCTGVHCEDHACTSFTVECEWLDCHSHECVPGEGCVYTWLCPDPQECHYFVCDNGSCVEQTWPDGTPCADDGDACTRYQCLDGACNTPITCDDQNECTTDSCDPATGCVFDPLPDGTGCEDDGLLCTDDVCVGAQCQHTVKDCSDTDRARPTAATAPPGRASTSRWTVTIRTSAPRTSAWAACASTRRSIATTAIPAPTIFATRPRARMTAPACTNASRKTARWRSSRRMSTSVRAGAA